MLALNNYSFIYLLLSLKRKYTKLAVGEFRTSESEENMNTYLSPPWLWGSLGCMVTNCTQRQKISSRVVEKRKEKLATLSSGGGDKAQEIPQLESSCQHSQQLGVEERDSQFSINPGTGRVGAGQSHLVCPSSLHSQRRRVGRQSWRESWIGGKEGPEG